MDVLIAGGGIAGLTLAAMLGPRGHQVTLVDPGHGADTGVADDGYALALWPNGTRVLHAVGVHDRLVERSLPMRRYTARAGSGAELITSPLPPGIARHGHLGIVPRRDLVDLLADACRAAERRAGRVLTLTHHEPRVEVGLDDVDLRRRAAGGAWSDSSRSERSSGSSMPLKRPAKVALMTSVSAVPGSRAH